MNEPKLRLVNIKRSRPGLLGYDMDMIVRKFPQAIERMEQMIEENFRSDFFVPASEIDREQEERMQTLLTATHTIRPQIHPPPDSPFA